MNYTAIGDAMNLAQRLEEIAGSNEIVIGPWTYELAGVHLLVDPLGLMRIRGRSEPIAVYRAKALSSIESSSPVA